MTAPLANCTAALAEGRQLEELADLLTGAGATVVRCPLLSIRDSPDTDAVVAWLRDLAADRFAWAVWLTGEGVRRLLGFADRAGLRDAVLTALGRVRSVTRGPKPVRALKELGLAPTLVAAAPTTPGVIAALLAAFAALVALRPLAVHWYVIQIVNCWLTLRRFAHGRATWVDQVVEAGALRLVAAAIRSASASEVLSISEPLDQSSTPFFQM